MELTTEGREIFKEIEMHCREVMEMKTIDWMELQMLSNAIDTYHRTAKILSAKGYSQTSNRTGLEVLRPEVSVMQKAYDQVLKHADKFGLNPASRRRFFSIKNNQPKPKKNLLDGLD